MGRDARMNYASNQNEAAVPCATGATDASPATVRAGVAGTPTQHEPPFSPPNLSAASAQAPSTAELAPPPLWLLLELTYRCPLHCAFCYNPLDFANSTSELTTDEWLKVLREARQLGAVQLGLSGGEPLTRDDLEIIVAEAHHLGFYTNLVTSGIGLTESRINALKTAGLDHIQLS